MIAEVLNELIHDINEVLQWAAITTGNVLNIIVIMLIFKVLNEQKKG